MFNPKLESQLIEINIVEVMGDFVSIQPDIDESRVQAAELAAQKADIKRLIGAVNLARCISPAEGSEDEKLKELLIPSLCYFTYARLLKMFPGTFTDGGFTIAEGATETGTSKSIANEHSSLAETFMQDVFDFLELEDGNEDDPDVRPEDMTLRIRVFGGKETRASN